MTDRPATEPRMTDCGHTAEPATDEDIAYCHELLRRPDNAGLPELGWYVAPLLARIEAEAARRVAPREHCGDCTDWACEGAAPRAEGLDVERFRRYEEHVGGLHCPEWHAETCEWQERCDEPGCTKEATAGFPTDEGYRRTCSDHIRWKK